MPSGVDPLLVPYMYINFAPTPSLTHFKCTESSHPACAGALCITSMCVMLSETADCVMLQKELRSCRSLLPHPPAAHIYVMIVYILVSAVCLLVCFICLFICLVVLSADLLVVISPLQWCWMRGKWLVLWTPSL